MSGLLNVNEKFFNLSDRFSTDSEWVGSIDSSVLMLYSSECLVKSGLYETMQFPMSNLATDEEIELVNLCKKYES